MLNHQNNRNPRLLIVGDYLFNPCDGVLSGPSGSHHVCPQMTALLISLLKNPGNVVYRDNLADDLWPDRDDASAALTQCVSRLRHYLGDTARAGQYIETVPNRGYRLVAPVFGSTADPIVVPPVNRERSTSNLRQQETGNGNRLYRLLREFRKRKVCRALLIYSIVIWVVFQVAEVTFPVLNIPLWINSLVVVLGILGFPVAATLAWIFDLTPAGLVRETVPVPVDGVAKVRKRTDLVFDAILATAAVAIFGMLVATSFESKSVANYDIDGPNENRDAIEQVMKSPATNPSADSS